MRRIIITGDDFGLAKPVNDAIVETHRNGILTTTSLMVGAQGAADAVEQARRVPSLKVGLHLVLVEGTPVLSKNAIPDLVDDRGEFSNRLAVTGFRYFFRTGVRRQLEDEIRAQFEAFKQTGLALDHVNAHNHMHLHPTILRLILKVGSEYGLRAVRLPYEPPLISWRASGKQLALQLGNGIFLAPWIALMKNMLRRARVHFNDFIFGIAASGAMTSDLVLRYLELLPVRGVTELYFHPATQRCPEIDRTMPTYQHQEEFRTLKNRSLIEALDSMGAERIAFSDL
jgi:hopanoid biosynthesis associated protein HpnK